MIKTAALSVVFLAGCALGCHQTNEVVQSQQPRIAVTVSNLPRLGPGEGNYELWAKFEIFDRPDSPEHDSSAVSLGEFNVTDDGAGLVGLDGNPARFAIPAGQDPQLMDVAFMTVQQPDSSLAKITHGDVGPTLLAGRVTGDAMVATAELDIAHSAALGSTFSNVVGEYTIIAPTSPADSNSGVWFIDKQGSTISAGLKNLPVLPEGWTYEGWIGRPPGALPAPANLSTGKFLRADSADFDGAGPGRGPGSGLNFPGEDFVNTISPGGIFSRPDLRFFTFMVTIEPDPDNSPLPFFLRVLSTQPPVVPLPQGQSLFMNNVSSASFPRARVTVVRSGY